MKEMRANPTPKPSPFRKLHFLVAGAALALASSQWIACGGTGTAKTVDAGGSDVAAGGALGRGGSGGAGAAGGHASGGAGGIPVGTGSGGAGGHSSAEGGVFGGGGSGGATSSGKTQCNDGLDNDGDGKIDLADPECVSPLDNDESSFATGIPGDNVDACKQDCFFDGNSGMGDDHCEWDLKCDASNVGATAVKKCEYDPNANNCPTSQPQSCINYCRPLTPNGCDCFGCCQVEAASGPVSVRLTATCTAAKFGDPTACPPCTQTPTCINDCKPCELCLGKTKLPAECYGTGGAGGSTGGIECLNSIPCGTDQSVCDKTGTLCISGCCVDQPL